MALRDAHESKGIELAQQTVYQFRKSGLPGHPVTRVPPGPLFDFSLNETLHSGRIGLGALKVAWDTNLLIDYFQHGAQMWDGEALSPTLNHELAEELEALQLILSLWVVRDIRFSILEPTLTDSKHGRLPAHAIRDRYRAWEQFEMALTLVNDEEEDDLKEEPEPNRLAVDEALSTVPTGNDRALVREALSSGQHVFLTRDKGILKAKAALKDLGLLLASPGDLLEELSAAGAFHCLMAPEYLVWPMPDQGRVARLIQALPAPPSKWD